MGLFKTLVACSCTDCPAALADAVNAWHPFNAAKVNTIVSTIEAELNVKDWHITNLSVERDKYNTIAANLQISRQKAYDNIAELEAIIEKMKSCENCESHTNVGSKCLLDMEDSLDCKANNYSNWKLKDNE